MGETSKMHIDSYRFGRIVVDGGGYTGDCLILRDTVKPDWWRKEGHKLCIEDLEAVLSAKPEVLVVGCGAYGVMRVSDEVRQALEQEGIRLEASDTAAAVDRFNELSETGCNVAAAMHLTC